MVSEHFGGGALELAWLESAWGLGVVIGAFTLGVWGGFRRRIVTGMLSVALMGIGVIALGSTPRRS